MSAKELSRHVGWSRSEVSIEHVCEKQARQDESVISDALILEVWVDGLQGFVVVANQVVTP